MGTKAPVWTILCVTLTLVGGWTLFHRNAEGQRVIEMPPQNVNIIALHPPPGTNESGPGAVTYTYFAVTRGSSWQLYKIGQQGQRSYVTPLQVEEKKEVRK